MCRPRPTPTKAGPSWPSAFPPIRSASDVFYLATAPDLFGPICDRLGRTGLARRTRPRGGGKADRQDLASARAVNDAVGEVFPEDRVYRIDHYLGKETVQNLMALRFANALFEPLWNAAHIDHVQITVAETLGRGGPRRLLRHRRRAARHGAEPHAAVALPGGDGAAGLAGRRRGARREAEGAEVAGADHPGRRRRAHGARPVPRRRLGRRAGPGLSGGTRRRRPAAPKPSSP